MVDLSIIIVSYNTANLIINCIQSIIINTRGVKYEIIVIDNNSQDNSVDKIKSLFPNIILITSMENLGFANANNIASLKAKGDKLLLLNPDTVVFDNSIANLFNFAKKRYDCGIWGGVAFFPDGTRNASCWNKMTPWTLTCRAIGLSRIFPYSKLFNYESVHKWDNLSEEKHVDIIEGCFLLIDRKLWEKLSGFNKVFFMYGEETDLCLRAKKIGAKPCITPEAKIIHIGGQSEASSENKQVKVMRGQISIMKYHWSYMWYFYGKILFIVMVAVRFLVSLFLKPPKRKGMGLDEKNDIWFKVLIRYKEWINGW